MKSRLLLGLLIALLFVSATMFGATSVVNSQQQTQLFRMYLINEHDKDDFIINKVDEKGNPLKDVEFEVYAKGEVVPIYQEQHEEAEQQ